MCTCSVPLDYFNESAGVAQIALVRYRAPTSLHKKSKGSVFFAPGGPGGSGTFMVLEDGKMLQNLVRVCSYLFVIAA